MRTRFVIEGPAARLTAEELAALPGLSAVVFEPEPVGGTPQKDAGETVKMIVEVLAVVGSVVEVSRLVVGFAREKRKREPHRIERIVVIRDERRLLDRLDEQQLAEMLTMDDEPDDPHSPQA